MSKRCLQMLGVTICNLFERTDLSLFTHRLDGASLRTIVVIFAEEFCATCSCDTAYDRRSKTSEHIRRRELENGVDMS